MEEESEERVLPSSSSCRLRIIASRQGAKRDGKIRVIIWEITRCCRQTPPDQHGWSSECLVVLSLSKQKMSHPPTKCLFLEGKFDFGSFCELEISKCSPFQVTVSILNCTTRTACSPSRCRPFISKMLSGCSFCL